MGLQRSSGAYAVFDWKRSTMELKQIARAAEGRVYAPESTFDLASIFDDLMENLRTRYVITYHSTGVPTSTRERTVRVALQDSRNGAPLTIIDGNGRPVEARISFVNRYRPNASAFRDPAGFPAGDTNNLNTEAAGNPGHRS